MTRLPALGPRGEGWLAIQLVLMWLAVAVAFGWNGAWSGNVRIVTTVLAGIAGAMGGVLVLRSMLDLGRAMTPLPRPRAQGQLVDTGAYALVRHPIYGGLVLMALGWGLFTASPAALLVAVALLGFFRLKSAREEAWLVEQYPGYEAYRRRTKRLLPFVY